MRSGSFRPSVKYGDDTAVSGSATATSPLTGCGTVAHLDDTLLRALFAAPPSEFVAARNELAKQLRRDKRRDEATAVAALRRPGWDDWALNVTAVEQAADVASFADAASAVRAAQAAAIEGRDGPDVRTSLHDLRSATTVVVRHATAVLGRVGRQAGAGELAGRLAEVAGSEEAVDQLRVGVLGAGGDAPAELFAGLEPVETATGRRRPAGRAGAGATRAAGRSARRAAKRRRRRRTDEPAPPGATSGPSGRSSGVARRRCEAATRARREAAKAADRAADAVDSATAAVRRAERALAEAEQALADAERRTGRRRRGARRGRRRAGAGPGRGRGPAAAA